MKANIKPVNIKPLKIKPIKVNVLHKPMTPLHNRSDTKWIKKEMKGYW